MKFSPMNIKSMGASVGGNAMTAGRGAINVGKTLGGGAFNAGMKAKGGIQKTAEAFKNGGAGAGAWQAAKSVGSGVGGAIADTAKYAGKGTKDLFKAKS